MSGISSTSGFQPVLSYLVYSCLPTKERPSCSRVCKVWKEQTQGYAAWNSWQEVYCKTTGVPRWLINDLTAQFVQGPCTQIKKQESAHLVKKCMDSVTSLKINADTFPGNTPLSTIMQETIAKVPIDWTKAKPVVYQLALKQEAVAAAIAWMCEPEYKQSTALFYSFRNLCCSVRLPEEDEQLFRKLAAGWDQEKQNRFQGDMGASMWGEYAPILKAHAQFIGLFVKQLSKPISQIVNCPQNDMLQAVTPETQDENPAKKQKMDSEDLQDEEMVQFEQFLSSPHMQFSDTRENNAGNTASDGYKDTCQIIRTFLPTLESQEKFSTSPLSRYLPGDRKSNTEKEVCVALDRVYQRACKRFQLFRTHRIRNILKTHSANSLPAPAPTPDS